MMLTIAPLLQVAYTHIWPLTTSFRLTEKNNKPFSRLNFTLKRIFYTGSIIKKNRHFCVGLAENTHFFKETESCISIS